MRLYSFHIYMYRDDIDISNFIYHDLKEEVVAKFPGQLKGEDFVIENCKVHVNLVIRPSSY